MQHDCKRVSGAPENHETALTAVVPLDVRAPRLDLRAVLGPLVRGAGDPTIRVSEGAAIRASVTPDGPGAIEIRLASHRDDGAAREVRAWAWGPGAAFLLAGLPAALGLDDDDTGFEPGHHPLVAQLARSRGRVRLGRTGAVWEALLPAILEQRITGTEAWRNYRRLVRAVGTPAPGPLTLWLAPTPDAAAALPPWRFVSLGIEPRRATILRRIAVEARRFEALGAPAREPGGGGAGAANLASALRALEGIGPWTAAEVTLRALGDPDALSIGDAHLSNVVAFALTGAARGTDEQMVELLAPWAGHRARVVRLLEGSGIRPPRYGPRVAPRDIARDLAPRDSRRGR